MLNPAIFRAYDIRGIVGETVTEETAYLIGRAFATEALEEICNKVVVGHDGRLSSQVLNAALIRGLTESGCDVIDIGEVPTPLLSYATYYFETGTGVMITGSHNPANYNGFKMTLGSQALCGDDIQKLKHRIENRAFAEGQGSVTERSVNDVYLGRVCDEIRLARPLKIVIDSGNGVTGNIAPQLFIKLGCLVKELFTEIDGHFPNHHPDPSRPDNLAELSRTVVELGADVGIAFDGDGDRIGVVDNHGKIIWPDRQMMLYAVDILSRHPGAEVIFDVKSTRYLADVISEHGGRPVMWKSGHSFIKTRMAETGALLAGEMSGHIFFKERWYGFDDALYTAARLLEIVSHDRRSVAEIFAALPDSCNTPEIHLSFEEGKHFDFMQQFQQTAEFPGGEISAIDGLRVTYPDGWALIRASNTQPVIVFRFEADTEDNLKQIQKMIHQQVMRVDDTLNLQF